MLAIANWLSVCLMFALANRHSFLLFAIVMAVVIAALMGLHGQTKLASEWVWLDIVGEGGTAVLIFSWLMWVARSRPGGRVTLLLLSGLVCVFLAMWTDA